MNSQQIGMAVKHFPLVLMCMVACLQAEIDDWQLVNEGGTLTRIAVNDKAVYAVNTGALVDIMTSDTGFANIGHNTVDVAVNGDYGVWIANTDNLIFYRTGTSSGNMMGSGWSLIDGGAIGVATGRYGLVLHYNAEGYTFVRNGITPGSHQGSGWTKIYGAGVKKLACAKRVCFCVAGSADFYFSTKFQNVDSPTMDEDWLFANNDTSDMSAYGYNTLWRLDSSGGAWQAVNMLDNTFSKFSWERRVHQTGDLKDIAVTDKLHFAISKDKGLRVLTGCAIFDFEDDDLSKWIQTGTAFAQQPVVSQQISYEHPSGKVGDRLIDTYSSRKNYSMSESAPEATIGDTPTGTLTSPMFQIRTDMLHFVIGGGSPSQNYVGLFIDGSEKFQSAGRSKYHSGPSGLIRSARYWWDVTSYKEKCAYLKIFDQGTASWGYTVFDDLRASPPCFKGMDVTLTKIDHDGNVTVGQTITDVLALKGFYTSKTRRLQIKISYPVLNGSPVLYIENINISNTQCQNDVDMTQNMTSSSSKRWHTVTTYLENYLLSDAEIKITSRVYDHDDFQINSVYRTMIRVHVNFFDDEYVGKIQNEVRAKRLGNETANIDVIEEIINQRSYEVGENITYRVRLGHNFTLSLQRAYNVMVKLFLPPFMTLVNVSGLENALGDVLYSPSKSQHVVRIPELLLDDNRTLCFDIRIDGEAIWGRKLSTATQGRFLVDQISYCPRKNCRNAYDNGTEVTTPVTAKPYFFEFTYEKKAAPVFGNVYAKINDNTNGLVVICGPYDVMTEKQRPNCYYGNSTSFSWYSLDSTLRNITLYDAKNKVIFGTTAVRAKLRLYGEGFERSQMLSNEDWNVVIADSGSYAKPKIFYSKNGGGMLTEPKGTAGGPWNQWQCCGG